MSKFTGLDLLKLRLYLCKRNETKECKSQRDKRRNDKGLAYISDSRLAAPLQDLINSSSRPL
jgi:hypothetical protein